MAGKRDIPAREGIVQALSQQKELHGAELARRLGLTQPPVWRALRQLEIEGVVSSRKVGTIRLYQYQGAPAEAHTAARLAARRAVQRVALRRASRGAGSDLVGLLNRRVVLDWWAVAEEALTRVRHAVVGGVASAAYMPARYTEDIDMAVAAGDVATAETLLRDHGWTFVRRLDLVEGTVWRDADGNQLDLISLKEPWAEEALEAARQNRVSGLPTMPLPYLALMKLKAGRLTDMGDLSRMLGLANEADRRRTRELVGKYGDAEDLEDLDQIIMLGDLERGGESTSPG